MALQGASWFVAWVCLLPCCTARRTGRASTGACRGGPSLLGAQSHLFTDGDASARPLRAREALLTWQVLGLYSVQHTPCYSYAAIEPATVLTSMLYRNGAWLERITADVTLL